LLVFSSRKEEELVAKGQIAFRVSPDLRGRLQAAANRKRVPLSEHIRTLLEDAQDRAENPETAQLTAPIIERILVALHQLEEMAARNFDPVSDKNGDKDLKIRELTGISFRAAEQAKKLMIGCIPVG
jgi:hypothetical protein